MFLFVYTCHIVTYVIRYGARYGAAFVYAFVHKIREEEGGGRRRIMRLQLWCAKGQTDYDFWDVLWFCCSPSYWPITQDFSSRSNLFCCRQERWWRLADEEKINRKKKPNSFVLLFRRYAHNWRWHLTIEGDIHIPLWNWNFIGA